MSHPPPHDTLPIPRKLSEELAELREHVGTRAVTLREVIYRLRGRAYSLLLILLCLPFTQPIPLPGLSTPIGLAIAFIAMRLALGQRPWLPKKLQRKVLPAGFFEKVFAVAAWVLRILESFLRPRWPLICANRRTLQIHAVFMLIAALVLLLPLPIPFSNTFPGWTILLIAAGMLERDGLFILLGYVTFAVGALYFILLGEAAQQMFNAMIRWFTG
ncbi:MAG: exopolysaccharide biosynthesis protein exod [Opitutaceae bacterium]|nr:exopolysaccharide biosynthesis protein exod [Opitutaceae bacterium]|tara:strand:- start:1586 stop:2233 length:648 start_codon:yes stop_codon:yes gene_type:complete